MINVDNRNWKAGIYGRVSTEKDNQKTSNENQISLLEEWAKSEGNIEVVDRYLDETSGTKIKKRHSFMRMLKDAKDGKIDLIIVKSVTRFARNQVDSIKLAKELAESGVRIFFYQEKLDTFKKIDMLGLWSWLAENESRATSERRTLGGREAQKKGRFTTNRPPLGYKSIDKKLHINDDEAPIVKRIFDLYLEGHGYGKIADILNGEGKRTRRGSLFRTDKIKYILMNETYKGTFIGNRYTKVDMLSEKIIERPKEDWIVLEDNHPGIIDAETFDKVQELIKDKSFNIGKRSVALFAGVVKCAKCGKSMNRNTVKKKMKDDSIKVYASYKCTGRTQFGKSFCDASSVSESDLKEIIQHELSLLKLNPVIIEEIKAEALSKINRKISTLGSDMKNIDKRIEEINSERKELTKKNMKKIVSDDIYMEMDKEYKEELKKLNKLKTDNTILDSAKVFEKHYNEFAETLFSFENIENLTNVEVRRLVDSIVLDGENLSVSFKINKTDFDSEESLQVSPLIKTTDMDVKDLIFDPTLIQSNASRDSHNHTHISLNNVPIVSTIGMNVQPSRTLATPRTVRTYIKIS